MNLAGGAVEPVGDRLEIADPADRDRLVLHADKDGRGRANGAVRQGREGLGQRRLVLTFGLQLDRGAFAALDERQRFFGRHVDFGFRILDFGGAEPQPKI